jgi:hypothetical protein
MWAAAPYKKKKKKVYFWTVIPSHPSTLFSNRWLFHPRMG